MTDLTTQTPVQIDERLATLYGQEHTLRTRIAQSRDYMRSEVARHLGRGWKGTATWEEVKTYLETAPAYDGVLRYSQTLADTEEALKPVVAEARDLNDEFTRRGGWTRAFLAITNGAGHVHSSMECSSCFAPGYDGMGNWRRGTVFQWLTDLSDHAETEIVELAGERACTICYSSAPVGVLSRPTQIFSDDEKSKAERRAERQAKAAERKAAEITVDHYFDYSDIARPHTFKSTRAVTNAIASALRSLCWYGQEHPSYGRWNSDVKVLKDALEERGIDYDFDKALTAARKSVKREGGEPKY